MITNMLQYIMLIRDQHSALTVLTGLFSNDAALRNHQKWWRMQFYNRYTLHLVLGSPGCKINVFFPVLTTVKMTVHSAVYFLFLCFLAALISTQSNSEHS